MSSQSIINEIVIKATTQLFAHYGVELTVTSEPVEPTLAEVSYAGIVGFTGTTLRGTLLVAPMNEPLMSSKPVDNSSGRDWLEELSNQLLGRIKNQLLAYGSEIYVTTPLVIKGQHLSPVPRPELLPYFFQTGSSGVSVWFDVEIAEGVELGYEASQEVASEGEAIFF